MMYTYILYLWVVVAAPTVNLKFYDWHYCGEFIGEEHCVDAARMLNKADGQFRCVRK